MTLCSEADHGPENRINFIAMYHAMDIETMRSKLDNGLSVPTRGRHAFPRGAQDDPDLEPRSSLA